MKNKIFGLDLVRAVAIFLVIFIHYYLQNNFYAIETKGVSMFVVNFLRWVSYSCVPLFMILTGYLMRKKELNKEFYKGIFKVITIYSVATILMSLYFYFLTAAESGISFYIMNFFSFGYYAWYIEMYLGLFLVIPFLNILYNNIKTKKEKQLLIAILIIVMSLAPMFNKIIIGQTQLTLMNDYWYIAYPLIYYFIGAYINEYKPKINNYVNLFLIVFLLYIETLITYFYYYKTTYNSTIFYGYGALPTVIISTLIFILLYDRKTKSNLIAKVISSIARLSLSMYLLSFAVDHFIYTKLHDRIGLFTNGKDFLKYIFPMVIISFTISYVLAFIVEGIINVIKLRLKKKVGKNEVNQLEYKWN